MYRVRLARWTDTELLPAIESDAGQLFATAGMADISAGATVDVETHRAAQARGLLWVAADDEDRPVGFALVDELDGCAYLKELAVHPDHGKRGLGTRLVDAVSEWARSAGLPAVTLCTFRDVPWNAPWYRRSGFRDLGDEEITPALRAIRQREIAAGLDRAGSRVCMRRETKF